MISPTMQLKNIDKQRYSKHYRITFWAVVAIMLAVSLSSSSLLIHFFGSAEGGNFWLNVAGVIIAALVVASMFRSYRRHPFMAEVMYVWQLKQALNRIYRKQRKIEPHMQAGDETALIVMNFYYQASKQLYELDNNTITMDDLVRRMNALTDLLEQHEVTVTVEQYDPEMLAQFH